MLRGYTGATAVRWEKFRKSAPMRVLANLGNKIHFTAADKQASEMIADSIGKHTIKKRTYGRSAGKNNASWTEQDEHLIKPHVLRALPKHTAIIKHCELPFRRAYLAPSPFTKFSHQP